MDGQSALKRTAKVGRASRTLGQLWQVPAFAVGLLALGLVAATAPMRQDHAARQFDEDCAQLRLVWGNKHEKAADYLALAESVLERAASYPAKSGLAHFLAASVYERMAEEQPAGPKGGSKDSRARAIILLEQAQKLGVPEDDGPVLLFRLGEALLKSGQDLPRALDLLARGVERGTDQPGHGYGMLAEGNLRLPTPNLEAALSFSQKQLEYTSADNENELWRAHLLRGEVLRRKGRLLEAFQELAQIPATAPKQIRLPARLLQTACCQADRLWRRAVPIWLDLLRDAADVPGGKAYILYQLGWCYHNGDHANDQEAETAWKQVVAAGKAEGQAASLRLGEMYLLAEQPNPGKGLAEWTRALLNVHKPEEYHNPLLTLSQARLIFENVWQAYQEKRDYQRSDELARIYKKIAAPGAAEELVGQSLEARARELLDRTKDTGPAAADQVKEMRALFCEAGAAYEAAADARPLVEQAPLLAHSANCWAAAQEHARAVTVLQRFVRLNNTETALAEGFLRLANALRDLGQNSNAREALYKCIEFPATPFAYRARYALAREAIENKDLEQAENILEQNLRFTGPEIDREAHEQSLYQLAALLFQRQAYEQATVYLKEAVRQYPLDPQAFTARDRLGFCFRWLADDAKAKLQERVSAEAKTHYRHRLQESLDEAARTYQTLADDLDHQALTRGPLSATNLDILRRAQFAVADIALEKNDLTEALRRYQQLLDNCRGQWFGIRACRGIWQCGKVMEQNDRLRALGLDATRLAIAKTLQDVSAMPDTHEAFHGENRPTRRDWLEWLQKVSTPAASPGPTQ